MKQRYIFDPEDFRGSGQLIIRNTFDPNNMDRLDGICLSYKIGYIPQRRTGNKVLLIALSDGLANEFPSKEALCEELNKDEHGYRPMTKTEIIKIVAGQGSRFAKDLSK